MNSTVVSLVASLVLGTVVAAQDRMGGGAPVPPFGTFEFVGMQAALDRKVVKGAPYSADAVTETTRALADGNRIVRRNTASFYRDREGRMRREMTLAAIGPWTSAGRAPHIIVISDPVAQVRYSLEPETRKAYRLAAVTPPGLRAGDDQGRPRRAGRAGTAPGKEVAAAQPESLGTKVLEGLTVQGTRRVRTIPAGQVGNERPVEIVTETWYSPDLQTVVMLKTTNPLDGDTTFRLTNIQQGDSPAALFQVPSDYTLIAAPKPGGLRGRMRNPQ